MKGERERPHVSDRGLDGKRANKKEPMERLSVPCLRTGHGVRPTPTSRVSQLVGAEEIRLYEMPPAYSRFLHAAHSASRTWGFCLQGSSGPRGRRPIAL